MVSYLASRRSKPAWWSDAAWSSAVHTNEEVLPHYYRAKLAADLVLAAAAKARGAGFAAINLRPGTLADKPSSGKVELGKTKGSEGNVSRESVALVADSLLASEGVRTAWLDLLDGEEEIKTAVERVVRDGVDAMEGEEI